MVGLLFVFVWGKTVVYIVNALRTYHEVYRMGEFLEIHVY